MKRILVTSRWGLCPPWMARFWQVWFILGCFWGNAAFGAGIQSITLKDQTVIRGEVLSMQNGVYSVKTQAMGTLTIPADQVVAIIAEENVSQKPVPTILDGHSKKAGVTLRRMTPGAAQGKNAPSASQAVPEENSGNPEVSSKLSEAKSRVQSMMMNRNFADKVSGLSENKTMEEVLSDPETMKQIQNMDYNGLMNNEKMKKLMDSDEIQNLLGNLEGEKEE